MTQEKERLPVWMSPGIEPPESIKQSGWQPGVKPPAQYMDWFFHRTYKVLEQLQNGGNLDDIQQELNRVKDDVAQHFAQNNPQHISVVADANLVTPTKGRIAFDEAQGKYVGGNGLEWL